MAAAETEFTATPTALYRLYAADGSLLYVGITRHLPHRMYQHSREKRWWPEVARKTVEWHPARAMARAAETCAIRAENPRHNETPPRRQIAERPLLQPEVRFAVSKFLRVASDNGLHDDRAIASHLGVTRSTITRALSGETHPGTKLLIRTLAAFPHLDFDDLFEVVAPPNWRESREADAAQRRTRRKRSRAIREVGAA